jgi:ATP-dependent DNA helicase RecG
MEVFMDTLSVDIRYVKGIGEKKAKLMNKLGLFTMHDLVSYFPRAYEDRTAVKKISELELEEDICIEAGLVAAPRLSHIRKGLSVLKFRVSDGTGMVDITCFNQPWLKDKLKTGELYIFFGRVGGNLLHREMTNPVFELSDSPAKLTRRI